MSGFSPDWLRLREAVDHRSRNPRLLSKLAARFAGRENVLVVDLGAGAGSNLRAVAPVLPTLQQWVLVDHDPALLTAAFESIAEWADASHAVATGLEVSKGGKSLLIEFRERDLAAEPAAWGNALPDLVTAAALFDLVSETWIEHFIAALVRARLPLYTALNHDGIAEWTPPHPADREMTAAFERHFGRDKGFGPSAGLGASKLLAERFVAAGYAVERGRSDWRLGSSDRKLIATLAEGWADAVGETGMVPATTISDWLAARRADGVSCLVRHEDLLALPG
ncbi:MAG TPA: class I SAM-dependent methyltransferase [Xanthobacteraceae bacterium]|nr:class I SAM-dependent methyltransferase [Xanthobacteraceae bacterium]